MSCSLKKSFDIPKREKRGRSAGEEREKRGRSAGEKREKSGRSAEEAREKSGRRAGEARRNARVWGVKEQKNRMETNATQQFCELLHPFARG